MIQGRKVHFLPEHELPDSAKNEEVEVDEWVHDYCSLATSDPTQCRNGNIKVPAGSSAAATTSGALGAAASANASSKAPASSSFTPFAGSGNSLASSSVSQAPAAAPASESKHPEASIQSLIGLGVSRDEAIRLLDTSGGNADLAARYAATFLVLDNAQLFIQFVVFELWRMISCKSDDNGYAVLALLTVYSSL